jgi:hypothetical protein
MHAGRVSATSRDGMTTIGFCIPAAPVATSAPVTPRREGAIV